MSIASSVAQASDTVLNARHRATRDTLLVKRWRFQGFLVSSLRFRNNTSEKLGNKINK